MAEANTIHLPWADDHHALRELGQRLNPTDFRQALAPFFGLELIGTYHHPEGPVTLADTLADCAADDHPEFFPLLLDVSTGDRVGAWWDHPNQPPQYIVVQPATQPGSYECVARSLFEYLRRRLEQQVEDWESNLAPSAPDWAAVDEWRETILNYATDTRGEIGGEYLELYAYKAESVRLRLVQAPTPEGMGVVLPLGTFRNEALTPAIDQLPVEDVLSLCHAALAEDQAGTALFYLKRRWAELPVQPRNQLLAETYPHLGRRLLADRLLQGPQPPHR